MCETNFGNHIHIHRNMVINLRRKHIVCRQIIQLIGECFMWKKAKTDQQASEIINWLAKELQPSFDFVQKELQIEEKKALPLYIKTVVDGSQLQQDIIKPFFELPSGQHFKAYLTSLPYQQEIEGKEQIILELTKGSIVVFIQGEILLLDLKHVRTDIVLPGNLEPTIQGPELSLSEDITTNINLIRHRYHKPSLTVEMLQVGEKSNQSLAVIFDKEVVNEAVLEKVKMKLQSLKTPLIQTTAELQRLLNDKKRSLLPTSMLTERTDRIIYNIAGGKVVLLLDGNPVSIWRIRFGS